jgi:hypothetical protein
MPRWPPNEFGGPASGRLESKSTGQRYSRHGNAEARDVFRDETSLASRRAQLRWRLGEFLRVSKPREVFKEVYRRRAA